MRTKTPRIRSLSIRFPLLTVALSIFLLLASVYYIAGADLDTDVTRLVPLHAGKTSLYFNIIETFGGVEKAYIIFSSDRILEKIPLIEQIEEDISGSGLVGSVRWRMTEDTVTLLKEVYAKKAPLLLSGQEMQEFLHRLSPDGMSRELEKTMQRLSLPGGQDFIAGIDPLNLSDIFSSRMKFFDVSYDYRTGYFLTPDKRSIIMILTPKKSPRDIAFAGDFVETVGGILRKYGDTGLSAELTGSHAITFHEASVMKREIVHTAILSLAAVLTLFLIFFRSFRGLLYVLLPVLMAIITTTGVTLLITGRISEVTGAFAGLITGLGIDLGIVLYVRYLVNLEHYPDRTDCMDRSISGVYRGITTGAVTTACIFFPMIFSSFRGVRELGILTGTGILFCWLFIFAVASLILKPSAGKTAEIPGMRTLALLSYRRPYQVMFLALLTSAIMAFFIPGIAATGDITKLGTKDNRARDILENLKKHALREQSVFLTDRAADMESALLKSLEIKESLSQDLKNISAPGDILPPVSLQRRNLESLSSVDSNAVIDTFRKEALQKGFQLSAFTDFLGGLREMLENREPLTRRELGPVQEVLDRMIIRENDEWRILVTGSLTENTDYRSFAKFSYTGPPLIRQELLNILKRDAVFITLIGLLLVNIILYLDFRRISSVLFCQIPVVISIIWVLGIMGLTGITLNFMNAVVFVMLAGIGTDYSVHLLHRYQEDRDIGGSFLETGRAIFVAGLTTVAGFGSVGFSSYRGLATMGQVAALGTLFCVILSICLIPSLLRLHKNYLNGT